MIQGTEGGVHLGTSPEESGWSLLCLCCPNVLILELPPRNPLCCGLWASFLKSQDLRKLLFCFDSSTGAESPGRCLPDALYVLKCDSPSRILLGSEHCRYQQKLLKSRDPPHPAGALHGMLLGACPPSSTLTLS